MSTGYLDCNTVCATCGEPIYHVVTAEGATASHECGAVARAWSRLPALGPQVTIAIVGFYDPHSQGED